jgi:pyrroline-5-carboxylate reductase
MARKYTLGVIGVGNMGSALVRGIVRAGALAADRIVIYDAAAAAAARVAGEAGVARADSAPGAAEQSDYVLLAAKPGIIPVVVREIAPALSNDQVVVSIAAGVRLQQIAELVTTARPGLIRVMPNTPALVGEGAMAVAAGEVEPSRLDEVLRWLAAVGRVVRVEEPAMDAATGVGGSGPAFVFLFIEALADGGVTAGLPREAALQLAAQTVLGAARMVLETGRHPAELKDMITTPAGTTVAGLAVLEEAGVRGALIGAVVAAAKRSAELSASG